MRQLSAVCLLVFCAGSYAQSESEPNDNLGQANVLGANTTISGDVGCANPGGGTDDYFAVTLPGDGTLNFAVPVNNIGTPGSMQFQVFNSGGGLIAYTTMASGTPGLFTMECCAAGLYYARLYRNTTDCYTYSISWSLTQPGWANDAEPNENIAEALPLPVNTYAEGHVDFLYYPNNADHYAFTTTGDGRITVSFDAYSLGAGAAGGAQLQFFNSGGGLLDYWSMDVGSNSVAAQNVHILDCRAAGLYYLRVYSNGPCGIAYRVRHQFTAPLYPNDVEPNNSLADADNNTVLAPNTNAFGHVNFQSYGDNADYYRILSPDQGIISFKVKAETKGTASADGLQVQLFNSGGGLLENWSVAVGGAGQADSTTVSTYCRGTGTYYLRFYSNGACDVSYRVSFTGTPPLYANDLEDNDNIGQAIPAVYNTAAEGRLAFYYDDGDDYYAISPPDQGVIHIYLAAENVSAAVDNGLQVQLFNSGGGLLENWSAPVGGGSVPDSITLNTSCRGEGTYFVRFYSNGPCGVSYRWHFDGTGPVYDNDTEDNDNIGQAQALAYGTQTEGRLGFYYDDSDDYYAITPADDGLLHIHWSAEEVAAGSADGVQFQMFNSGGGLIGNWSVPFGGASTPASFQLDYPCMGDGTYYLRCYLNSSCGLSYRLSYDVTPPLFGADTEPDNTLPEAPVINLDEGGQDGRLSFYYEDNDDYYAFIMAGTLPIVVNTLAENIGAENTMQLQVFNSGGGLLFNTSLPVGGNGIEASGTATFGPFDPGTCYLRLFSNGACGVSYRILCNDEDGDGICDGFDLGAPAMNTSAPLITASPNPSTDGLFRIRSTSSRIANIEVFGTDGRLVQQQRATVGSDVVLDLSHEPEGMYTARVRDSSGGITNIRLVRTR